MLQVMFTVWQGAVSRSPVRVLTRVKGGETRHAWESERGENARAEERDWFWKSDEINVWVFFFLFLFLPKARKKTNWAVVCIKEKLDFFVSMDLAPARCILSRRSTRKCCAGLQTRPLIDQNALQYCTEGKKKNFAICIIQFVTAGTIELPAPVFTQPADSIKKKKEGKKSTTVKSAIKKKKRAN